MMLANPRWERAAHLKLLNEELLDIYTGDNDRLMVFMPPGHGKSSLISETYPTWRLMHDPDIRTMFVSYEHDFAAGKGRACRELYREWGVPATGRKLSPSLQSSDEWGIDGHRGVMWSAGVGGPLTGRRAELIIIDDPVKNQEQANSQTYRDKTYEWYISTLRTRLEPGGAIIIVMTRWHEDDLAGRLLLDQKEKDADKWKVISLPAIAEENDPLGRKPGEALWPSRFPLSYLEQTKKSSPVQYWISLYCQRPRPEEGSFFQLSYFRYFRILRNPSLVQEIKELEEEDSNNRSSEDYDANQEIYELTWTEGNEIRKRHWLKEDCLIFQTVDTAATEKTHSDYFVIGTWAMTPDRELLLLDIFREKAETTKHLELLTQYDLKFDPSFQGIENKTFGQSLVQMGKKAGLPVKPLVADTDKIARALTVKTRYETGMVYHLIGASWLTDYETELLEFPNGKHDDQVDVAAYAGILVGTSGSSRVIPLRKKDDNEEAKD
jgi:predicted phage terminase large subunit-like protein